MYPHGIMQLCHVYCVVQIVICLESPSAYNAHENFHTYVLRTSIQVCSTDKQEEPTAHLLPHIEGVCIF